MKQIRIVDKAGNPVRYAYIDHKDLKFEFEYYARNDSEGDYEVIQTVSPKDFELIAGKFGFDPSGDILAIVQEISDSGRGGDLVQALNDKEIPNEIFTWSI